MPKGLDFSLRCKSIGITHTGNHGYALTSKKALKNILLNIPYSGKTFLDIGSGKGGVICFAYELGCIKSEGLECENFLHNIAKKNIQILNYKSSVISTNIDARLFNRYSEYDIYFMFNPFDDNIYAQVIDAIVKQVLNAPCKTREKYLICYGHANLDAVYSSGVFTLQKDGMCPYRGNSYKIYKISYI